jgi:catechol 2,3-dioxygenase-like lactoylglutathione lyase family enzyme
MAEVGYIMIGTNDLDRAKGFYDALFGAVGGKRGMALGDRGQFYTFDGGPMVAVNKPFDGEAATPANGGMIALNVGSKEAVAAFHAKALEMGATCEGPPGPRGTFGTFAYVRDADGNKICACVFGQV